MLSAFSKNQGRKGFPPPNVLKVLWSVYTLNSLVLYPKGISLILYLERAYI